MKIRKVNRHHKLATRKRQIGRNLHHLTPRSRRGKNTPDNLLLIHIERHDYWHRCFGNRTLEEVIALLLRLARMKGRKVFRGRRQAWQAA